MKTARAVVVLCVIVAMLSQTCTGRRKKPKSKFSSYIYYDVRSSANPASIKAMFRKVNVRHIFKVFGVHRYLAIVNDDQSRSLNALEVLDATTVIQYPLGTACQAIPGKKCRTYRKTKFNPQNIAYVKFEFKLKGGTTTDQMKNMTRAFLKQSPRKDGIRKFEWTYLYGRFPPRFYAFLNARNDQVQAWTERLMEVAGGPGNAVVNYQHLMQVQ